MIATILFTFSFITNLWAIAPTSENGRSAIFNVTRNLSSKDLAQSEQEFEFLRVEDDLGIVFRFQVSPTIDNEWKVYPSGFPMVNVQSDIACEKNFAKAIKVQMEQLLTQSEKINLVHLRKFNEGSHLKAWITIDENQINKKLNLKVIQDCQLQVRKVSQE